MKDMKVGSEECIQTPTSGRIESFSFGIFPVWESPDHVGNPGFRRGRNWLGDCFVKSYSDNEAISTCTAARAGGEGREEQGPTQGIGRSHRAVLASSRETREAS